MFNTILIVCTGNICRSPVAEYLLRRGLEGSAGWNGRVFSAGTGALVGQAADETVESMMRTRGFDLSPHRARQLTPEHVRQADLILVMEKHQRQAVLDMDPTARGKTFLLGHWIDAEIADPYQRGEKAQSKAIELIAAASAAWLKKLASGA